MQISFWKYKSRLITHSRDLAFEIGDNIMVCEYIKFWDKNYCYNIDNVVYIIICVIIAGQLKTICLLFLYQDFCFCFPAFRFYLTISITFIFWDFDKNVHSIYCHLFNIFGNFKNINPLFLIGLGWIIIDWQSSYQGFFQIFRLYWYLFIWLCNRAASKYGY